MINFNDKINLIWQIAESLRGVYKPENTAMLYSRCVLSNALMKSSVKKEAILKRISFTKTFPKRLKKSWLKQNFNGLDFYNISPFGFKNLCDDQDHLKENL